MAFLCLSLRSTGIVNMRAIMSGDTFLLFLFLDTLWNRRSFLTFLFQSTVSFLQPKLAPSLWSPHSFFLHARTTGMCHHAQLKCHAPLNHLSPAPRFPFFWKWFPSLGSDRLKYWRLYLVSSHFHINKALSFVLIRTDLSTLAVLLVGQGLWYCLESNPRLIFTVRDLLVTPFFLYLLNYFPRYHLIPCTAS